MLKKTSVLLIFFFVLTSCSQTNDEKAREAVEHYGDAHFKNYLPFGFKKLQPLFTSYKSTPEFAIIQKNKMMLLHQRDSMKRISPAKQPLVVSQNQIISEKLSALDKQLSLKTRKFKGIQIGWTIYHSYTYKNESKAVVRTQNIFILNLNFTKIIEILPG